jgi:hypothetical protein
MTPTLDAVNDFARALGKPASDVLRDFQESQTLTIEEVTAIRYEQGRPERERYLRLQTKSYGGGCANGRCR